MVLKVLSLFSGYGGAGLISRDDGTAYTLDTSKSCSNLIMDFRYDEGFRVRENGLSPTIHTKKGIFTIENQRVRYLTPKEYFRLMGFFNDEFKFGNLSDSALYNLAGDGWDINIASKILRGMFPNE